MKAVTAEASARLKGYVISCVSRNGKNLIFHSIHDGLRMSLSDNGKPCNSGTSKPSCESQTNPGTSAASLSLSLYPHMDTKMLCP